MRYVHLHISSHGKKLTAQCPSDVQHSMHFEQRQIILELFLIFLPDFLRLNLFYSRAPLLGLDLEIK